MEAARPARGGWRAPGGDWTRRLVGLLSPAGGCRLSVGGAPAGGLARSSACYRLSVALHAGGGWKAKYKAAVPVLLWSLQRREAARG
jgi:hypothetical protein